MADRIGTGVLRFGIEKLLEEIHRDGRPNPNSLEWTEAVLDEVATHPCSMSTAGREISDPAIALDVVGKAMAEGGRKKVREVCASWSLVHLQAVLRELHSRYSDA